MYQPRVDDGKLGELTGCTAVIIVASLSCLVEVAWGTSFWVLRSNIEFSRDVEIYQAWDPRSWYGWGEAKSPVVIVGRSQATVPIDKEQGDEDV